MRPRRRPAPQPTLFDEAAQPSLLDDENAPLPDAPPKLPWRKGAYRVPTPPKIVYCQSCGREIIWTRTPAGKAIPLSVATSRTETDGTRTALSHFSDCKHAKQWSKKK